MASLNRVELIGSLGQDPELRYTPTRVPVVTLSVATSSVTTDENGERQEKTEWHRVVVWNRQAENCAQYLTKGRQVFVEGRLHTRTWEDKNGSTHYSTEIVAHRVQFLGRGRHDEDGGNEGTSSFAADGQDDKHAASSEPSPTPKGRGRRAKQASAYAYQEEPF